MGKIRTLIEVRKLIKNFGIYLLDYLGFLTGGVTYHLRNGIQYRVAAGTHDRNLINEIWIHKNYTKYFDIKPKDVVVDVGGHIGIFSIFAAHKAKKGRVYSFEPVIWNMHQLAINTKINNIENITIFPYAVYDKLTKLKMSLSDDNRFNSIDSPLTNKESVTVKTLTLEKFFENTKEKKINFLKMDCEGAEYKILLNLPREILNKIEKIAMEYHLFKEEDEENFKKLLKFLGQRGYDLIVEGNFLYAKKKKSHKNKRMDIDDDFVVRYYNK